MTKSPSLRIEDFTLRQARQSDYAFAERLYIDCMKPLLLELEAWNETELLSNFRGYYNVEEAQIVSLDGADVGWLQVSEDEQAIHLDQLYLLEGLRSRGIGSHLIRELCDAAMAKEKPVQLLLLRNNPALSLYQRLGFKIVGQEGHKLHMRWDAT